MYYIIEDNKIVLADEDKQKLIDTMAFTPQYQDNKIFETKENEVIVNFELMTIDEKEAREQQAERERIARLELTKREVFLGLYQAKGVTPEMIKAQITDPAVLIEFEYASSYFRGNPLVDSIGNLLGYSKKDLDYFFENKEFPHKMINEDSEEQNAWVVY